MSTKGLNLSRSRLLILFGSLGAVAAAVLVPTLAMASGSTAVKSGAPAQPPQTPISVQVPPQSAWPKSTTATTVPSTGSPSPIASSSASPGIIGMQSDSHEPTPVVSVPKTPCTDAELSAAMTSQGPWVDNASSQYIITISSGTLCELQGYPTLQFSNSTGIIATTVQNGGTVGSADPPSPVAVGPGVPASFLLQFGSGCPTASSLEFGLSSGPADIPVTLDSALIPVWLACPTTLVSPFEQGNDVNRYV